MAEIEVKNLANEVIGKLELSDAVFKADFNQPLIWEAVKHYNDSLRAGTASTKVRGEVSGSGKKLWRQKGTGRARELEASAVLYGGMAVRFTAPNLGIIRTGFRERSFRAPCARRFPQN